MDIGVKHEDCAQDHEECACYMLFRNIIFLPDMKKQIAKKHFGERNDTDVSRRRVLKSEKGKEIEYNGRDKRCHKKIFVTVFLGKFTPPALDRDNDAKEYCGKQRT